MHSGNSERSDLVKFKQEATPNMKARQLKFHRLYCNIPDLKETVYGWGKQNHQTTYTKMNTSAISTWNENENPGNFD